MTSVWGVVAVPLTQVSAFTVSLTTFVTTACMFLCAAPSDTFLIDGGGAVYSSGVWDGFGVLSYAFRVILGVVYAR